MKTKLLFSSVVLCGTVLVAGAQQLLKFEDYYIPKNIAGHESSAEEQHRIKQDRINLMKQVSVSGKTNSAPIGAYYQILNHSVAVANIVGSSALQSYVNPVFQDSVIKYVDNGKLQHINEIKHGQILDPKSEVHFSVQYNTSLTQDVNLDQFTPYTIDTLYIGGLYRRRGTSTADDTLQIELTWGNPGIAKSPFGPLQYLSTADPILAGKFVYSVQNVPNSNHGNKSFIAGDSSISAVNFNKIIIKRVLKVADTATSIISVALPTPNQLIPAGNVVGVMYTFVPGYTYTSSDIYWKYGTNASDPSPNVNSFRSILYGEPSTVTSSQYYFYDDSSWGISQVLDNDSRYGKYSGAESFRNNSSPSPSLGIDVGFGVHATPTGIKQLNKGGLAVLANYPNPFSENTSIVYEVSENSVVTLSVYDVTGKKVMAVNKGKQEAGKHTIELSADKLNSGIYFYTLTAGSNSLTQKMIVTKN